MPISTVTNEDCMIMMSRYPDKFFELAIVDPPYFEKGGTPEYYRSRLAASNHKPIIDTWVIPDQIYFTELFRVSKRQIIWGVNYYSQYIPHQSRIVWDKVNDNTPFSQADLASYSEGVKVYMFRYKWNGMLQHDMKNKEDRIHPTQKPVQLYKWLLTNYAKPGDKILDTHLGSGSSRIAAYNMGFDFYGCELDPDYFKASEKRFKEQTAQQQLFDKIGHSSYPDSYEGG